jgi:hypothetical protein
MLAALALSALLGFGAPVAHTSSSISVNDEARLLYVQGSSEEDIADAGQAKGSLPGHVKAILNVGADVHISFTLYARTGSLTGRGVAKIHGSGKYISFAGNLQILRGTGHYAGMHGGGKVYGVLNRESLNSTVQVVGKLGR